MTWIPVSSGDRPRSSVLVWLSCVSDNKATFVTKGSWYMDKWWNDCEGVIGAKVEAWQSIFKPAPYRAEREDG